MVKFHVLFVLLIMCCASCLCMQKAKKEPTEYDREMAPLAVLFASGMNNPEVYAFFKELQESIEKAVSEKSASVVTAKAVPASVAVKTR